MSVYYVEDPDVHRFSKHDAVVSRNTIVEVIYSLVTIVEDILRDEMKKVRGALLFDGWAISDTHYVACVVSFFSQSNVKVNGSFKRISTPRMSLLSLGQICIIDDDPNNNFEVTTLNADSHISYFSDILRIYGVL